MVVFGVVCGRKLGEGGVLAGVYVQKPLGQKCALAAFENLTAQRPNQEGTLTSSSRLLMSPKIWTIYGLGAGCLEVEQGERLVDLRLSAQDALPPLSYGT